MCKNVADPAALVKSLYGGGHLDPCPQQIGPHSWLVSDDTELGREEEDIRKDLQVNSYPYWMLADSGIDYKALEGPRVPAAKKKYPVVLPYVRAMSEQLRRVFRSFHILAYLKPAKLSSNYW